MRAGEADRLGFLRWLGWVSAAGALTLAVGIVSANRRHHREVAEQIRERHQLKLRAAKEHIERYMDDIWLSLRFISLESHVTAMSRESEALIQAIYEANYARHRLSEIYVIERNFDGLRRPFMSFEKGDEDHGIADLHTLEREKQEYAAQVAQIRRFAADPALSSLISPPVDLCVGGSGLVCSVPIRSEDGLVGIVAGMVPSQNISDVLEASSLGTTLLLASAHGDSFCCTDFPSSLRRWFDEAFASGSEPAFFKGRGEVFQVGGHTALWDRVTIFGDSKWHIVSLYDEAAFEPETGVTAVLAGWGGAGIVLLLGGAVTFLCRFTPALSRARQEADSRARELLESEARTRAIVGTAAEGIITFDEQGVIESFNAAAERVFGYTADEARGRNVAILAPDSEAGEGADGIAFDLRPDGGAVLGQSHETSGRRKDGRVIPIEVAVSEVRRPGRRLFTGIIRDIRERKRAEQALRDSRSFLQTVIDAIPDPLLVIDRGYRVELANRAARDLSTWDDRNPSCLTCYGIMHDFDEPCGRKDHPCPLATVFATAAPVRVTQSYRGTDGHEVVTEVAAAPIKSKNGEVIRIIHQTHDITARVQAEDRARQRQADLAHLARLGTMGEMASGLAHELSQPLAAIANYVQAGAERIRSDDARSDDLRKDLSGAAAQADRAGAIIDNMRRFVRKGEARRRPVQLNKLVRGASELVHFEARKHGVRVRLELAEDLPPVAAEAIQIEQVIVNLMRNAFEAMDDAWQGERALVLETARCADGGVRFGAYDTGPGVAVEAAQQVFDPFFTTKPDGLGMGLGICRTIIEGHGGRLWAAANPAGGAVFHFRLPDCDAEGADWDED